MKNWLIAFFVLLFLILSCIYIFIPGNLSISVATLVNCTVNGTNRCLSDENKWQKWWPGPVAVKEGNLFIYKSNIYQIEKRLLNGADILINDNHAKIKSTINAFQSNSDSSVIEWHCTISSGSNPFNRIAQYGQAIKLKKNMDEILASLRPFLEKNENVYGVSISKSSATDSFLIATKSITPAYPSVAEVYKLINFLKAYISKEGAQQTNSPMMNVTELSSSQFQLTVAVPINKKLSGNEDIFPRKMVNGNFLVATVHGGLKTVDDAINQMQLYFQDYQKTAMAIPFELLITDRMSEPDTTKWITKIYAPVLK